MTRTQRELAHLTLDAARVAPAAAGGDTLLQDFVAFVRECMLVSEPRSNGSPNPVRAATLTYSHLFEQNRGLMKCLMNHYEEFPQARAIFQEMNRGWIETVVKSLTDHTP